MTQSRAWKKSYQRFWRHTLDMTNSCHSCHSVFVFNCVVKTGQCQYPYTRYTDIASAKLNSHDLTIWKYPTWSCQFGIAFSKSYFLLLTIFQQSFQFIFLFIERWYSIAKPLTFFYTPLSFLFFQRVRIKVGLIE